MVENNVLQEEDKQKTRDGAAGAEGKGGKRSPGNKQTAKNLLERNEFVIFAADK